MAKTKKPSSAKKRVLCLMPPGSSGRIALPKAFLPGEWEACYAASAGGAGADIAVTLPELKELKGQVFEAVFVPHGLKHLYFHEAMPLLSALKALLAEGGVIVATLPDIQAVAEKIAAGKWEEALYDSKSGPITPADILFGFRPTLEKGVHAAAHRSGYTAHSLGRALKDAGFFNIRVKREGLDLTAQAYRIDAPSAKKESRITLIDPSAPRAQPGKLSDDLDLPPVHWKARA